MNKIILASASPRRKELLRLMGLAFRVSVSDYDEDLSLRLPPHDLARHLSAEKARAVAHKHRDSIIIAADTFIVHRNHLLGKPHTDREAFRMLCLLNGQKHTVITGLSVLDTGTGKMITRSVETKVWFRKMEEEELRAYVQTGEPLDKAGAYAIQGTGSLLIKKIDGDYFNVIGLPVATLAAMLKKFGIEILKRRHSGAKNPAAETAGRP